MEKLSDKTKNIAKYYKFLLDTVILFLSLMSLIWFRFAPSRKKYIHYYVLDERRGGVSDHRSNFIKNLLFQENTLNLVYAVNGLDYIGNISKIFPAVSLTVLPGAKFYGSNPLEREFRGSLLFFWLLRTCPIRMFLVMDDPRFWNFNINLANYLKTKSFAYMHARFNEYHKTIFSIAPDFYLVWNGYFERKYKAYIKREFNPPKFKICKEFFPKEIRYFNFLKGKKKSYKILLIEDDFYDVNVALQKYSQLYNDHRFYVRYKYKTSQKNKLLLEDTLSLCSSVRDDFKTYEFDFCVAAGSSVLIEAPYFGVVPLFIDSGSKYPKHLIEDDLALDINIISLDDAALFFEVEEFMKRVKNNYKRHVN